MAKNSPTAKRSLPSMNYYLILYNTLSCLGWGCVLVMTCLHIANIPLPEILSPIPEGPSPVSFQSLIQYIREPVKGFLKGTKILLAPSTNTLITAMIPPQLSDIYNRMTTTYGIVGPAVAIVQTAAALEIVHALSGLVKSPLLTAVIQVYSRLFLVWAITMRHEQSRHNALYSTMILAWSTTEVIRYAFYTLSLARGKVPGILVYLRYTTFYILYPIGASSEALLIFSSLPITNPLRGFRDGSWNTWDYFRGVMFIVWWPGLVVMMSHMMRQRRKVFGRGPGGTKLKSS